MLLKSGTGKRGTFSTGCRALLLASAPLLLAGSASAQQQTFPQGNYAAPVSVTSGAVTAAVVSATMPAVVNQTNFLTGFEITANNATAGCYQFNLTGVGSVTLPYFLCVPGGNSEPAPVVVHFDPPLTGAAQNTAIVLASTAAVGAGTSVAINMHGFRMTDLLTRPP